MAYGPKVHDYQTIQCDAAGAGQAQFDAPFDFDWHVERIAFTTTSVALPNVTAYVGSVADINLKDYSTGFAINVADESKPIYVPGGQSLFVVVDSADPNAFVTVTMQRFEESLLPPGSIDSIVDQYGAVDGSFEEAGFPNQVRAIREGR